MKEYPKMLYKLTKDEENGVLIDSKYFETVIVEDSKEEKSLIKKNFQLKPIAKKQSKQVSEVKEEKEEK